MLSDENKLRIFSGNANPDLAREIAAYLGTTVGDAVINRFNNGEVQVMINESNKTFSKKKEIRKLYHTIIRQEMQKKNITINEKKENQLYYRQGLITIRQKLH